MLFSFSPGLIKVVTRIVYSSNLDQIRRISDENPELINKISFLLKTSKAPGNVPIFFFLL